MRVHVGVVQGGRCTAPLQNKYSQRVRNIARRNVCHISKEDFLSASKDALFAVVREQKSRRVFEAAGLVVINAQAVLDRLKVRLRTPPEPLLPGTPWQSKTPSNTHEYGAQSELVHNISIRSPVKALADFSQLIKGGELMLHRNALQASQIHKPVEQSAPISKRELQKRKQNRQGDTMGYRTAAAQEAAKASAGPQQSKKAPDQEPA
ncbi:hypothetical protein AA0113_g12419 [Alternaria arborescens]|jgi:hypothetical protein|uniref:Uncharacterized protein n=2 Tax=Alternaria sect. Alternaria TaxID=2499237 RepID=A0A4Q4PX64_9PLEO|nr:hypothetical protein AA0112_g11998 [Alternaria arborescens]RYN86544.1 hypothetical protein AA0119_g12780 [Alternaria tenuissima]RYO03945.1 hypothetical protein AA0121_g12957 [Alternaria tenuissima]RYO26716.1 hypothetical protein AA0113_g12419 [Alternaria arborescens]